MTFLQKCKSWALGYGTFAARDLQAQIAMLKRERDGWRGQVDTIVALNASLAAERDEADHRFDLLFANFQKLSGERDDLKQRAEKAESDLASVTIRAERAEAALAALKTTRSEAIAKGNRTRAAARKAKNDAAIVKTMEAAGLTGDVASRVAGLSLLLGDHAPAVDVGPFQVFAGRQEVEAPLMTNEKVLDGLAKLKSGVVLRPCDHEELDFLVKEPSDVRLVCKNDVTYIRQWNGVWMARAS